MSVWAILQARMTSTRMPGKVLREAGGRSILGWVVRAVRATQGVDGVCVAIPEGDAHLPVVEAAKSLDARVVRGSEHDVLNRFAVAARQIDADIVMRVTTDCPMSDPQINAEVLSLLDGQTDYACNNQVFGFPHGLDCEVFTRELLERAETRAFEPYDREHVTPWMKKAPDVRRRALNGPGGAAAKWRWTIDFEEDFAFFSEVAAGLGDELSNWRTVSRFLEKNEHLHDLNRMHRTR